MRVVNPTFGTTDGSQPATGLGQDSELRKMGVGPIGLLSNAKPNSAELLEGIAARLQADGIIPGAELCKKPNPGTPASDELIDFLAKQYQTVLVGTGD